MSYLPYKKCKSINYDVSNCLKGFAYWFMYKCVSALKYYFKMHYNICGLDFWELSTVSGFCAYTHKLRRPESRQHVQRGLPSVSEDALFLLVPPPVLYGIILYTTWSRSHDIKPLTIFVYLVVMLLSEMIKDPSELAFNVGMKFRWWFYPRHFSVLLQCHVLLSSRKVFFF